MKWNNLAPDIHATPLGELVGNWSVFDVMVFICQSKLSPYVILDSTVRNKILDHLNTSKNELGGLLLGSVISVNNLIDGIVAISIFDAIASRDFKSSSVSLSMDPSVWQLANIQTSGNLFVVGWYHSHPNLGAFFSGTDRKTQRDFFSKPYNLGLVIDPIRNEERWFLGSESQEIERQFILRSLDGVALE